jgi:predicted DNA-binding ribbon-helix-helix protein
MVKAKPKKEVVIQSSMRIRKPLWEALRRIADSERLSMAQVVERALIDYCDANDVDEPKGKGGR